MNTLQKKLNNCVFCSHMDYIVNIYNEELGYGKLGAHFYEGSDNSIMVVGQNPSHVRYKGIYSMSGKQGVPFRDVFGKEKLVFTNFIQISTPDNKVDKLSDFQIIHCIEHLLYEIRYIKPKVIIVCSTFAKNKISALFEKTFGIKFNSLSKNVYFIKHPDYYITYNRSEINGYYKELKKIKKQCCS